MQAVRDRIDNAWKLPPTIDDMLPPLRLAANQWFANALVPSVYPDLIWVTPQPQGSGSPNWTSCEFSVGEGGTIIDHPWRDLPASMQVKITLGFIGTREVKTGLFATDGFRHSPSGTIGNLLFNAPDARSPGLGLEPLRFFDPGLFDGRLLHADDASERCDLPSRAARRSRRPPATIPAVGDLQIIIAALFVSAAGLNALANWLRIPYPIPLVLGGLLLGLVPGIPEIELDPDLVLLVFLPPLLYSAAFFADLRSLRDGARPIALTAIGLVLVTAAAVAVVAHEVIELPWAISFALGAIVSPTDPVAATAILRRVGAPRRIVNIIEGESLVNDATALVAYKVAVAAAVGESVSACDTVLEFFGAVAGGIAIGLAVGYVVAEIRRRIDDPITSVTISLFTAYGAFIPADEIGASGVLAVVTAGIYLGWRAPEIVNPEARMQGFALWSVLTFLLNATLFILIGLQLPLIVDGLQGQPMGQVVGYAALVCAS